MRDRRPIVAIDGPAGAGKSTVTKRVARALNYTQVDTGALYRALAWACGERGVSWDDGDAVARVARDLAAPGVVKMSVAQDQTRVFVHERDVSDEIRTRHVAHGASIVSQIPKVREHLLDIQRALGARGGVVLEGRDIGTVVFPDAEAKFYLTATAEVRAARRQGELAQKGEPPELADILAEVKERDLRDTMRPIAPLTQAPDAIVVDSSRMNIDQVVDFIVSHVRSLEG
ncbi:MAG TPA: (d)CMP kinase [Polyangiaceae bacterium]|nr:(d)CMP kinase [Polyangiaceae bacterium]